MPPEIDQFLGKSIENSLSEVFVLNENTLQFIYVNRGAKKNTLYSQEELQAMRFPDICTDISEDSFCLLASALDTDEKETITIETEFTRKNKEKYPVFFSIHKSRYLASNVCIVQAHDISEKIQYKADLRKAYDLINKSKSIAFIWQNKEGLPVSFVSENVSDAFGYDPEDFLVRKLSYTGIIHPEDRTRVLQDFKEISGDRTRSTMDHDPYRIITRGNEERRVKVSSYIQRDIEGNALFFQGIVEDITNLKHHEDELFKSNRLMEKTFQSISDIVMLLDPEFRIMKINKAGRLLLDRPQDEIIGCYCHDFFPDSESFCDLSHEVFDSKSLYSEEIYLSSFKKYFIVSYAPIFNDAGEVIFIVNVLKDITENKLMEERLFLSEKMTTIASLAAGVAHEINTPLSAILQSIQIIQMGLDPDRQENRLLAEKMGIDPPALVKYIHAQEIDFFMDGIKNSALNASKIITNLLNFSRPQKGELKEVCINDLIDDALDLAKSDYDLKKKYDIINVTVNKEYDPDLPNISCIPMEIEQVFLNLIKNAVHALAGNPPGTVPSILIKTLTDHSNAIVQFEDNGPGIDKKILSKIFDPFFTTKEVGVGTGLGLSLSYSIIHDKHYGNIYVETKPGRGARFIVKLPLEKKDERAKKHPIP